MSDLFLRWVVMLSRNARFGLKLFFGYLFLYGSFVLLSAFAPSIMELQPIAGLNLAVLWGFGLIIAAVVFALVYGAMCADEEGQPNSKNGEQQ